MIKVFIDREKSKIYNDKHGISWEFFIGVISCASWIFGIMGSTGILNFNMSGLSFYQTLHFHVAITFILTAWLYLAPILAKSLYEDKNSLYFSMLEISPADISLSLVAKILVLFKTYFTCLILFNLVIFISSFSSWGMNIFTSLGIFFTTVFASFGAISLGLVGGLQNLENSTACAKSTFKFSLLLFFFSQIFYLQVCTNEAYFSNLEACCWLACFVCAIWMPRYVGNKKSLFWGLSLIFLFFSSFDSTRYSSINFSNFSNPVEAVFYNCQGLDPDKIQPKDNIVLWKPIIGKRLSIDFKREDDEINRDILEAYESQYWAVRQDLGRQLQIDSSLKIAIFCSLYILVFMISFYVVKRFLVHDSL